MRKIDKGKQPPSLRQWCAKHQSDINYGYELIPSAIRDSVKDELLREQGWICAYSGRAISRQSSHIEHLKPQTPWKSQKGMDVDYANIVACWPEPGYQPEPPYGARFKGDWPAPGQEGLFVSPLRAGCEDRFLFSYQGEIKTKSGDKAAAMTVQKLGLAGRLLTDLRKQAVVSVIGKTRSMKLADAKLRLKTLLDAEKELKSGADIHLDPYCFALKQVLRKHIRTLESIRHNVGKNH